jgi:Zn-dependent M28 family amino/carboxypeptidase
MLQRSACLLLPLFLLASVTALADAPTKDTSAWWGHVKVLASDEYQGRLTGSPGYQQAATYVANSFRQFGLEPAGQNGYFQTVDFQVQTVLPERSRVTLVKSAARHALSVGDDLVLSAGVLQRAKVAAPLIFAGYGIHLPEAGYDDFDGLAIKGAIVVYLVGGPAALTGAERAHAYAETLPHYLEQSGAVGVISIIAPRNREVPWARMKAASVQPGMLLADIALRRYRGPMFAASFNELAADQLFDRSGHRFAELTALADAHQPLPRFPLRARLEAKVATRHAKTSADNVVAELRGSDPAVAGEAIVLSAHLDHLGTGKPDHGDGVFHGAMDDATGVASLLEVARAMHVSGHRPRRSILFVAVSGEEKGLLGSRFFAAHPTRHASALVADINMDMFLPLFPLRHLVGFGADESSLGDDVRAIGAASGVELVPDPAPDHLIFVRSDQYNFVRKGTPSLMLAFAPQPGTAEEAIQKTWFSERYHAQADDLSQPVDLAAAEAYDDFLLQLITRVADSAAAPSWHKDSFFARFGQHPLP